MSGNPINPHGTDSGHFGWQPCGLSVVLKDGTEVLKCHADTDDKYGLNASLSQDFPWDTTKRSWRWHKVWCIPDCVVTAHPEAVYDIGDLEAQFSVVCQGEKPHQLEQAGIQSLDCSQPYASLQFVDACCRFSRLRLVGTTSTFGGLLFHFVVSIVRRDGQNVTVLASVISTAFSVYSCKNVDKKRKIIDREAMIAGRWSMGYSFVPFDPKELDRKFIKKATNSEGVLVEEPITNSWEGLLAYFQAPNIRFKIRHPLFLAIRFSNVLVILKDALRVPQESEEALRSFVCSCGFPLNCKPDQSVKLGHGEFLPPWLIAFRSSAMNECSPGIIDKLTDLMKIVKGPALGFVPGDSLLPESYSPTFDMESLGQLYAKLYAIEFAGGEKCDDDGAENTEARALEAKKVKTNIEPMDTDGLPGFHPCETPIFTSDETRALNNSRANDSSSASSHGQSSQQMRSSFESYFTALHGELRMLLQKVVGIVSGCVVDSQYCDGESLRKACEDFTEAHSVHAFVEEHVLFKKLANRVPKVTESYSVDRLLEKRKLDEISNHMKDMDPKKVADLFLKISDLSAVHTVHMEKVELHILPYFLNNFDDAEISDLIRQSQAMINQLVNNSGERINLMNPRHQNAIEGAPLAAGMQAPEEDESDPLDDINEHQYFSETRGEDDVIALILERYS